MDVIGYCLMTLSGVVFLFAVASLKGEPNEQGPVWKSILLAATGFTLFIIGVDIAISP